MLQRQHQVQLAIHLLVDELQALQIDGWKAEMGKCDAMLLQRMSL